jgi:hypothetical protein
MFSWVTVNLVSSAAVIADLSRGHVHKTYTSNDGGDEVGVDFSLYLKLITDSNTVFLLVIASSLGTDFTATRHMLNSCNKIR